MASTNPPKLVAGQVWSAKDYAANAGFVPALGADVFALLDAQNGEDILDLGCGDGVLTARLMQSGANVIGLEPDPSLAAAATARKITVLQQDAHDPFGVDQYVAVFSNAALHWMRSPETVIANVYTSLRPGGRFVAEQGGFGNVAAIVTALNAALEAAGLPPRTPWDFPSPSLQRQRLRGVGFDVSYVALIPRPTPLPTHISGWLQTFAGPFVGMLKPDQQTQIIADTERRLNALHDPVEGWMADYVRLRFVARKPV
jgi:SAM-dependent methyltransferase